jgi:nitroimidazol reductase NimA-like FMN-containing flavoprotein (pyridoxamine 5'-phosphate oxidase superfamily)
MTAKRPRTGARIDARTPASQALTGLELQELLARRLIASLATLDAKGGIHLVPLWYMVRKHTLLFPTSSASRKVKNLAQSSVATAMIHSATAGPDLRGAMITGPVEVLTGSDANRLNRMIHLRYMTPAGMHQSEVLDILSHDDVTLRLQIERVVTWKFRPGRTRHRSWSRPIG